jgi:formylglycine-generating enzyme required for sulfatase activity
MKTELIRGANAVRGTRLIIAGMIVFGCVISWSAQCACAGSIFDDDWAPPKPISRPTPAASIPTSNPATVPHSSDASLPSMPKSPRRHPLPAKQDLARSRRLLQDAFADQLKDRSMGGRRKLALALLDEAAKTVDNLPDKFALLSGTIQASKDAEALRLSFQAADRMGEDFEVDALSLKTDAALRMNLRGDSPAATAENVQAALELIDPLAAAEEYSTAIKILTLVRPLATGDAEVLAAAQKRAENIEALRAAHDRFAQQVEKLKTSPNDPAANTAAGSYLCFGRGDWETGLPLLAKGSDANFKQLAILELSRPAKAEDVIGLADGWWGVSAKQLGAFQLQIRRHAASLYGPALDGATGIRRKLMEKRIAEAAAGDAGAQPPHTTASRTDVDVLTNSLGMRFLRIKPGTFVMGSPATEEGRNDNEVQHEVKLTKSFMLAATPVTQHQWLALMGNNPSRFKGENLPVEQVSWDDAADFCKKLSQKEGKHYRLPTEAQWEYACRATTTTAFNTGAAISTDKANYNGNGAPGKTTPVGSYTPNKWGLYDMHGNVRQWCSDVYDGYPSGEVVDPVGPEQKPNASHVMRGGSWYYAAEVCRSARRDGAGADSRSDTCGFRIVLAPP